MCTAAERGALGLPHYLVTCEGVPHQSIGLFGPVQRGLLMKKPDILVRFRQCRAAHNDSEFGLGKDDR
jgi:hypothetical protein